MAASRVPLEILHEFIRHSSSSPSTLAAWSLTSHDFFDFASPLLYQTVVLKRSEDIIPFLKRLLHPPLILPSPLLPFSKVQRLEILALPPPSELDTLLYYGLSEISAPNRIVLAIDWGKQEEDIVLEFVVPALLLLLLPERYEHHDVSSDAEEDTDEYLEGPILQALLNKVHEGFRDFPLRSTSSFADGPNFQWLYLHSIYANRSHGNLRTGCRGLRDILAVLDKMGFDVETYHRVLLEGAEEVMVRFFHGESEMYLSPEESYERSRTAEETTGDLISVISHLRQVIELKLEVRATIPRRHELEAQNEEAKAKAAELRKETDALKATAIEVEAQIEAFKKVLEERDDERVDAELVHDGA